jgi:ABC-2 type transport system ATP-binding protein
MGVLRGKHQWMDFPVLAAQQLVKRFGSRTAVDGVSFKVYPGEAVGLLGPNGAGKSTTLSLITGLLMPDAGSVWIHGRELAGDTDPSKRHLGLAPQELALYEELTAADNLNFFGRLYGLHGLALQNARTAALDAVGLADRASEPVRGFSGGMKRRLNLAVALLHEPDLLLLDEPTVGVDPQSRNSLLEKIALLRQQGRTILYTTDYMEEVERLCERVIVVDHGRILADARVTDLKVQASGGIQLRVGLAADHLTEARKWLTEMTGVSAIETVSDGLQLLLSQVAVAGRVLELLERREIPVLSLATRQPSLEDVFLQLTGRTLRD